MDRFGQKKLYRPSRPLPMFEIIDRLHRAIVILDCDLSIRLANPSFVTMLGIQPGRTLVGARLYDLDLPLFNDPMVRRNIERAQQSQKHLPQLYLDDKKTGRTLLVEFDSTTSPFGETDIMVSVQDITAARKAETDLRASEKRMATLFGSVPSGIILFSADGEVINANRASLRALGLRSLADLQNASVFDIACYRERLLSLIRDGRATVTEFACDFDRLRLERGVQTTKCGVAFFEVSFTPIPSEYGGPPKEFAILFKDITAKRRAEKEMKERLQGVSTNLPGIVYQFYARDTGEWGVYHVDDRSEEVYGLPREPLNNWFQRYSACIAPEDQARWVESIQDVIRRVAPWDFEGRFLRPTGGEMYIRGISQPIRSKNETIWNGIFLDISDRKRAEEDLRASTFLETRYRSFFEEACNGVLIYEPVEDGADYVIKDVNRVATDLLRMDREELIGKRLFEEFPAVATPEVRAMVRRVHATGRPEVAPPIRYRDRDDFPWISRYIFRLPSGEIASFMIDVPETLAEAPDGADDTEETAYWRTLMRPDLDLTV